MGAAKGNSREPLTPHQHFAIRTRDQSFHKPEPEKKRSEERLMEAAAKKIFLVTLLLVAISSSGVFQVSNAQTICKVPLSGLMACKPAVTPPNPPAPAASCCSALSKADLHCFCSYRNSSVLPSLGIDPNLAMQLPSKCRLSNAAHC